MLRFREFAEAEVSQKKRKQRRVVDWTEGRGLVRWFVLVSRDQKA